MMIKIAICDDDCIILQALKEKISALMEQWHYPYEISCYIDACELPQAVPDLDILFLDIQMPQINGMAYAKALRKRGIDCSIIFITALNEYVFEAFEVEATDFLCKPLDFEKLTHALQRAISRTNKQREKCLLIQTMNWCKSIKFNTILYCEVMNRKVYLHTQNEVIDYYCKIEEMEKKLDSRFIRCHRSFLVNLDYVYEYANGQIKLENGALLPVSRLRHQSFMQAMLQYMKTEEL